MADSYSLDLVQGQRYERAFRYKPDGADGDALDLTTWSFAGFVRQKEALTATPVLDLTPYLSLDEGDATLLRLSIPAGASMALTKLRDTANWDIRIWPTGSPDDAIVLVQGPATLDPTVTPEAS